MLLAVDFLLFLSSGVMWRISVNFNLLRQREPRGDRVTIALYTCVSILHKYLKSPKKSSLPAYYFGAAEFANNDF